MCFIFFCRGERRENITRTRNYSCLPSTLVLLNAFYCKITNEHDGCSADVCNGRMYFVDGPGHESGPDVLNKGLPPGDIFPVR